MDQDGTRLPSPKRGQSPLPNFRPYLLWPNGWIDQDATWYGGRPLPRRLYVRWRSRSSPKKRGGAPPQIFGPCLLWPKRLDDQDGTWHRGKPQPRRLCVRWGPSPNFRKRVRNPEFLAHVYCGQTAVWVKMALGTMVGLGSGHIVLGDPAPLTKKGAEPPIFGPFLLWPNGWIHPEIQMPLGMEIGLRRGDFVLDWDSAALPKRGGAPKFRPRILWPNGCMDQDATWYGGRLRPTRHCVRWGHSSSSHEGEQYPL